MTRTYSREGTQTLVLHTSMMNAVKTDALVVGAEERSTVAVAGTARTRTRWQTMPEIPAQARSGRGTRSHRCRRQSHDDHLEPKGVPDLLVRTVYEANGVGGRQDEVRRCGDACDSLVYLGEEAVVRPDHRRLVPAADRDRAVAALLGGTLAVAVDTDLPLEVTACPEAAHEPRRWVSVQAEDIGPARPAEVASDQRFVDVGTPCGQERRPVPVTTPV